MNFISGRFFFMAMLFMLMIEWNLNSIGMQAANHKKAA